jgi:hypothetical protein
LRSVTWAGRWHWPPCFVSVLTLLVGIRHIAKTPTELREVWESMRHLFAFRIP